MQHPSPFTPAERLESVKVAIAGGLTAGLISLALLCLQRFTPTALSLPSAHFWSGLAGVTLFVNGAIAALSGSLFALTYRYAIRQDANPQLKSGVVLAFTLVRGLAQVDVGSAIAQQFWPFLTACSESLLLFGGSAIVLNLALAQTWLKPFGQNL
ncbi:MAG: hypothetical protein AAF827_14850 [Cyanobacteria bacterium P01_D01_bin.6]